MFLRRALLWWGKVFLLSRFFKKFAKNKNAVVWSEKFFRKVV